MGQDLREEEGNSQELCEPAVESSRALMLEELPAGWCPEWSVQVDGGLEVRATPGSLPGIEL